MVVRRCPKCGTATDDVYGFCIKCGYEFPEIPKGENACPLCGFPNPDEADFCVKCGTPLIFKSQFEKSHNAINPIIIKKEVSDQSDDYSAKRTSMWVIAFGYLFSVLGGILGLIIAIYLSTRKNPQDRRHGHIQLAIFGFYVLIILIFIATGNITPETLTNYTQLVSGNFSSL